MQAPHSVFWLLALAPLLGLTPHQAAAQGTTVPHTCGQVLEFAPSAGTTSLVGPGSVSSPTTGAQVLQNSGNAIYVCGYTLVIESTSSAQFEYGTGTNCGTGAFALSPVWPASTTLQDTSPFFRGMAAPAGTTLCLVSTGTVLLQLFYDNLPL